MARVDFDEHADSYNDLLREGTSFFSDDETYFAQYKVDIARGRTRFDPEKILEFGCGIGRNIPFLINAFRGSEVSGSDVSEKSLEIARRENPKTRFLIESLPASESERYGLIFIAGVFHHIPPSCRPAVIESLYSRLLPSGKLFVFEHNPYNPVTRRIVAACPYDEDASLLTPAEMSSLLTGAGFEVTASRYALFFPPRLRWLLPMERILGWLPLGGQYWVEACR